MCFIDFSDFRRIIIRNNPTMLKLFNYFFKPLMVFMFKEIHI